MIVKHFFDKATSTLTYVVHQEGAKEAVIIDPVWDFDPASGRLTDDSVKEVIAYLEEHDLTPVMNIETHAHADHLSGSQPLKQRYPQMDVAISNRIKSVQALFGEIFNIRDNVPADGRQFDYLFTDFEEKEVAGLRIKAIPTPGHTPACMSYLIEDALFTGDAMFMPDYGTGRCDFPEGSARTLYRSVKDNLFNLPDKTRVFVGHDYQPQSRPLQFETTIGEQKAHNIQLNASKTEEEFVKFREARDATLAAPKLLLPSLQVNIRGGHLPSPENNGKRYLKLPLQVDV